MKKFLLVGAIVCSLVGSSFAASDPCKDKVNEAKKLAAKCKAMPKGPEKTQCAGSYKVLKNQEAANALLGDFYARSYDLEEMYPHTQPASGFYLSGLNFEDGARG